jgi:hypothetical protein
MIRVNPSSFDAANRRCPAAPTENFSAFRTVPRCIPNTRAASRILISSTWQARRMRSYSSTEYILPWLPPAQNPAWGQTRRKTSRRPLSDHPAVSGGHFSAAAYKETYLYKIILSERYFFLNYIDISAVVCFSWRQKRIFFPKASSS